MEEVWWRYAIRLWIEKKYVLANMKQYDSYLIYGCHFPSKCVNIIKEHSTLKYFNQKLQTQYNCYIFEANIPHMDDTILTRYFLQILLEQSDASIIKLDKLDKLEKGGYEEVLKLFELDVIEPYLISVPIVREL